MTSKSLTRKDTHWKEYYCKRVNQTGRLPEKGLKLNCRILTWFSHLYNISFNFGMLCFIWYPCLYSFWATIFWLLRLSQMSKRICTISRSIKHSASLIDKYKKCNKNTSFTFVLIFWPFCIEKLDSSMKGFQ